MSRLGLPKACRYVKYNAGDIGPKLIILNH